MPMSIWAAQIRFGVLFNEKKKNKNKDIKLGRVWQLGGEYGRGQEEPQEVNMIKMHCMKS